MTYALNSPTLSSPSNGSTLSAISASLQWNSVSGANRYQWQCDTAQTFDSPLLVTGNATSYYATASGLHYGETYYWRVRACAASDTSTWSSTRTFTTPARVALSYPANGASLSAIAPSLEWSSMSGTTRYQWQCDTASTFDSPLLATGSSTTYYVTASGLHYGFLYYWRVRSCTAADTSDWSLVRTFTTPARITLSYPANGASLSAIAPSLEWSSMSGTTRYQWQCDTASTFDSPLLATGSSTTYYVTASGLHYGFLYYWRVRSCTAADTSDWSLVRTFTTPARVTLSYPANGASLSAIGPSLEWNSISGTTRYQWQCDTASTFDSPLLATGSSTTYYTTASGLHYGFMYYWRVRACTTVDTSEWSLLRTFTTPARITLSYPANGAILTAVAPSLEWSSMSGTTRYQWQCDTASSFDSPLLATGSSTTYYTTASGLHYGKTYYWRVRSCTASDTSEWSLTRTFTTPARVTLSSPSDNTALSALSTSLQWNSISGTTRYIYQYDVTPEFNTPHLISSTSTSYYISISGLNYNTTYYWRVCAYNAVDTSEWSLLRTFKTPSLNMVTLPTLISPTDGSTAIPSDGQVFTWDTYPNAQSYELEYSTSSTFTNDVVFQTITGTNTQLFGLDVHTTYYWRVRVANGVDFSPWSNAWSFTTANCLVELYDTENVSICENDLPYTYHDTTFEIGTTSASFQLSDTTSGYCDTLRHITINLTVNPVYNTDDYLTLCTGQLPYTYGDTTFEQGTETGIYPISFITNNGCDSIVNLHLTMTTAINTAFAVTACGSYTWNNVTYNQSGIYTQSFINSVGCDSIVSLNLTLSAILYTDISETACETYQWNGQIYNQSGVYTQTLTSINGCDSVVTLSLTIAHPVSETITATACDSYFWNGQLYTASGTYQQLFPLSTGCDSIVTLQLTINQPVTSQENITICENDLPYTWNGIVCNEAGTQTATLTSANGCDSIVTLTLSTTEINTEIVIAITTSNQDYADIHVIQQNAQYQWINCSDFSPVENATHYIFTPAQAGEYACIITYNNCSDTTECITATFLGSIIDANTLSCSIFPNPVHNVLNIHFTDEKVVNYAMIYDVYGRQVIEIPSINSDFEINVSTLKSGTYFISLATENGMIVKKFVKE